MRNRTRKQSPSVVLTISMMVLMFILGMAQKAAACPPPPSGSWVVQTVRNPGDAYLQINYDDYTPIDQNYIWWPDNVWGFIQTVINDHEFDSYSGPASFAQEINNDGVDEHVRWAGYGCYAWYINAHISNENGGSGIYSRRTAYVRRGLSRNLPWQPQTLLYHHDQEPAVNDLTTWYYGFDVHPDEGSTTTLTMDTEINTASWQGTGEPTNATLYLTAHINANGGVLTDTNNLENLCFADLLLDKVIKVYGGSYNGEVLHQHVRISHADRDGLQYHPQDRIDLSADLYFDAVLINGRYIGSGYYSDVYGTMAKVPIEVNRYLGPKSLQTSQMAIPLGSGGGCTFTAEGKYGAAAFLKCMDPNGSINGTADAYGTCEHFFDFYIAQ